ncbi:aminotransferase class I/II-fold pyridoxal phosphate-dependent enzyme [Magnetovirga frankeli]|uniref:trans-sulfuration enzyme family protein n=1 Tax=Magnetovirga frankeli TaxID=947516 RepID=UPI0012932A39|nr:aminotransferase class I/II-fold pyridoxal phosphate-dependent enzyme [gamma proteobacterium SS-5]
MTELAARCVHAGEMDDPQGSPHSPLYSSTTFKFPSTQAILDVVEGRTLAPLYTRYGLNPTILALEEKLAALENAEAAWAFCSGMAAEAALFVSHGRKGVICIGDAYGGTLELLKDQLPLLGIPGHFLLGHELDRLPQLLQQGAGLVFFETPTNPALEIFDIAAIAELAHRHGALVAVDNTFASPVNQQPLALGADFAVHSCTKYLGGHSDLTAGAIMASKELLAPIWGWRKNLGQMLAPETAALLARSIRTLPIRVQQQNANAQAVAEALSQHPRVSRVLYPGLDSFPGKALAARQMSGFGGMLSFEVAEGGVAASAVADRLRLFALAPSLGGVESLITQPCTTTHHGLSAEERARRGISDGMLRLSIGLEDPKDLIADLHQALAT